MFSKVPEIQGCDAALLDHCSCTAKLIGEVSGGGGVRATIFPLSQKKGGWGRKHIHCSPAGSLLVHWTSPAESKELMRGLIPTRKQGKVLPKMSLALFLAHL